VTGAATQLFAVSATVYVQQATPPAWRAHALSAYNAGFIGFVPAGAFAVAAIASVAGVRWALIGPGLAIVACAAGLGARSWAGAANPARSARLPARGWTWRASRRDLGQNPAGPLGHSAVVTALAAPGPAPSGLPDGPLTSPPDPGSLSEQVISLSEIFYRSRATGRLAACSGRRQCPAPRRADAAGPAAGPISLTVPDAGR
jgi:hypothetical protein